MSKDLWPLATYIIPRSHPVELCGFIPWKGILRIIRERAQSMGHPPDRDTRPAAASHREGTTTGKPGHDADDPPAETPDLDDRPDAWCPTRGPVPEPEVKPTPAPAPEPAAPLYRLVADHREPAARLVLTPAGRGLLWQVFGDRAGVVLEAAPGRVVFFDPSQITVPQAQAG